MNLYLVVYELMDGKVVSFSHEGVWNLADSLQCLQTKQFVTITSQEAARMVKHSFDCVDGCKASDNYHYYLTYQKATKAAPPDSFSSAALMSDGAGDGRSQAEPIFLARVNNSRKFNIADDGSVEEG
jgi:hypothetical protein